MLERTMVDGHNNNIYESQSSKGLKYSLASLGISAFVCDDLFQRLSEALHETILKTAKPEEVGYN